jgi:hypothetical protein
MIIYERNIDGKIWILRVAFMILVSTSLLLYKVGFRDAGFISIALLLLGAVIPVSDLQVYTDRLAISQYYCFGFLARRKIFGKDQDILLSSFELELENPAVPGSGETVIRKFILRQTDRDGRVSAARLQLSELEYDLVKQYFHPIESLVDPQ